MSGRGIQGNLYNNCSTFRRKTNPPKRMFLPYLDTLSIISLEGTSVVFRINKHKITVIIKRKTPNKIKSPNFNLHIRKPDTLASKTFTTMVRVLDNTIPSILVYGGNFSLSHPDGPFINAKQML